MSAAARRAVGNAAVSRRVEARGGQRLSRHAWQDVRRACRLAGEGGRVRAVDIHGVHISFFASPSWQDGISGANTSSDRLAQPAKSLAAQERPPRPANSRQRRSAKRLESFLSAKKASAAAAAQPATAALRGAGLGDIKADSVSDEAMDAEAPASPRREQKRLLDEASETLAERSRASALHRPAGGEAPPWRRYRRPGT